MTETVSDGDSIFWIVVLIVGCALVGLTLMLMGGLQIVDYFESNNWNAVSGEVLSAAVDRRRSDDETLYRAVVTYTYVVNDVRYTNDRLRFDAGVYNTMYRDAQQKVEQYEPGMAVTVLYDPNNPQSAILERSLTSDTYLFFAFGLAAWLAAAFFTKGHLASMDSSN